MSNYNWVVVKKRRYIPWLNCSLPIASFLHNIDLMIFPNNNFWLFKPAKSIIFTRNYDILPWSDKLIERANVLLRRHLLGRISSKVIANSHFNSSQISLTCKVPEEKISVIYNGIDPAFLSDFDPDENKYGDYILYVGGTEHGKNISRLIRAHEKLVMKGLDIKLVIVGGVYSSYYDIELPSLLNDEIISKDSIILHGIERDTRKLANLYRHAKATVFPSLQESFGMVSLEAMACGCPLVTSRAPAIPEIAGDAAEYFDPYDIDEMASKIEVVLTDEQLRRSLVNRGYERIKKYNWNCSAGKLLQIFEEIGQRERKS
jgi:glycosyltransferase involved in cell wall biosynthesis